MLLLVGLGALGFLGYELVVGASAELSLGVKALGVGFLAGMAGATIGGGIALIAVPLVTLFLGFPLLLAVGTNLVHAFFAATSGVLSHRKRGNVKFRLAVPLLIGSAVGAPLGALTSTHLDPTVLAWTFASVVTLVAGYLTLQALGSGKRETDGFDLAESLGEEGLDKVEGVGRRVLGRKLTSLLMVALTTPIEGTHDGRRYSIDRVTPVFMGAGVGFMAGMLGVGGGFLLTPLMTTALMIPAHLAVGTALVVGAGNAFFGGLTHLIHGNVSLVAATFLAIGGMIGANIGSQLSGKLSDRHIRGIFIVVLLVVGWNMAPISLF